MTYVHRCAEDTVKKLSRMFGAVMVAGPRQVGKSTMLEKLTEGFAYVNFDDPAVAGAAGNGDAFFSDNPPPVFLDEVQKAPGIFPFIKMRIDRTHEKGRFYLCGSQQIRVMRGVTESLAGRVGLLNLPGFSLREICGTDFNSPFLPTEDFLSARKESAAAVSPDDVWGIVHRGSMPELCLNADMSWKSYYAAYLNVYLERDVRDVLDIRSRDGFSRFLTALAGMCGKILNVSQLASDCGISVPTAESWLSVLENCSVIYLLRPYHGNVLKKATKTPKVYFLDTGLCAYLCGLGTADELRRLPLSGAFFENFVISEIIKSYYNAGYVDLPLYYYRDRNQKEIDLIIDEDGTLYPVEIKEHSNPSQRDVSAFSVLDGAAGKLRGPGGVVCLCDRTMTLSGGDRAIPVSYL